MKLIKIPNLNSISAVNSVSCFLIFVTKDGPCRTMKLFIILQEETEF